MLLNSVHLACVTMGDVATPFTMLVVCTANVCRSATAQAVLTDALQQPVPVDIGLESRGTRAMDGELFCATASRLTGVEFSDHRSRLIDREVIDRADLILTMERAQRGFVVEQSLGARRRTFTLREAVQLTEWLDKGAPVPDGLVLPAPPPIPELPRDRLTWWVVEMDAGRGLAGVSGDERIDISDPHATRGVDHAAVTAQVVADSEYLARYMRALVTR